MKNSHDVIFVYGALRSGTTVFRLMLDAHPQLGNPGEMDFLFDHLTPDNGHPTGWRYDLDNLREDRIFKASDLDLTPNCDGLDLLDSFFAQLKARAPGKVLSINLHRHVDRVFAAMPEVRVLHMLRDPRDVARSSIQMGWAGTLYHGVAHWVKTERAWDQGSAGVAPEQILEITYEGLFRDIDATLREVCAFFGVPFTQDMLSYHENTTYGPPDVSLTEQWRRKCGPRELAELETCAPELMANRGYPPEQPALDLSVADKRKLSLRNATYRWRAGMKRFGALLYWSEKLTRWAGLTTAHRTVRRRMDDIITLHRLK